MRKETRGREALKGRGENGLRRCLVTGETRASSDLLRFVADPKGSIHPDISNKLEGRGLWITPHHRYVAEAVKKRLFFSPDKRPLVASEDLPQRVGALLRAHALSMLGLARRKGDVLCGRDTIARSARQGKAIAFTLCARDSKSCREGDFLAFSGAEMESALGRSHLARAALIKGKATARLLWSVERYMHYEGILDEARDCGKTRQDMPNIKESA